MTRNRPTRRTVLKLTGAAIIGGVSAVGTVGASEASFDAQKRAVTNVTKKYQSVHKALRDGFEIMGPYVPDMGFHLVNFDRIERASRRGINIRKPQGLIYNLGRNLGSVEYIIPLGGDAPNVYNDEGEGLATTESEGWHPHGSGGRTQHVFANRNGVPDDRSTLSVDELLTNDNWAELSDENPAFPDERPDLEAGDELTVNWGHQPGNGTETRVVDFIIEHQDWWTLHAWFHFDNPEGVFAPFNHNDDWDTLQAPPHH